jgi:hypothetical protein
VLVYPQHVIEILNRLASCAFAQIVQAGNNHQASSAFIERNPMSQFVCPRVAIRAVTRRHIRTIERPA